MMVKKQVLYSLIIVFCIAISAYLIYKFNKQPINNISPENTVAEDRNANLPINYTMEKFAVEKDLGIACKQDLECETPSEYMMISRCPMRAICLNEKCTVVCPSYKTTE
jgi:hypothetical protein